MIEGRKIHAARLVLVAKPDRMDAVEALRLAGVVHRPDDLVLVMPNLCEGSPDPAVVVSYP